MNFQKRKIKNRSKKNNSLDVGCDIVYIAPECADDIYVEMPVTFAVLGMKKLCGNRGHGGLIFIILRAKTKNGYEM